LQWVDHATVVEHRGAGAATRLVRIPVGRTAEGFGLFAMDVDIEPLQWVDMML